MADIFTRFVQALLESAEAGSEMDSQAWQEGYGHLAKVVDRLLVRRNLADGYPEMLGIPAQQWTAEWKEAFVRDCFSYAILEKLPKLAEALATEKSDIDGLIHHNIAHYFTQRQRRAKPVEYRIFRNLKAACLALASSLAVCTPDPTKFSNKTVVLRPGQTTPNPQEELAKIFEKDLEDKQFVKVLAVKSPRSVTVLTQRLETAFTSGGLVGFSVKSLLELLRSKANERLTAKGFDPNIVGMWEKDSDEFSQFIRMILPEVIRESDRFDKRIEEMRNAVIARVRNPRIRSRLLALLEYWEKKIKQGAEIKELTQADAAKGLGITRQTLNDDIQRLRSILAPPHDAGETK